MTDRRPPSSGKPPSDRPDRPARQTRDNADARPPRSGGRSGPSSDRRPNSDSRGRDTRESGNYGREREPERVPTPKYEYRAEPRAERPSRGDSPRGGAGAPIRPSPDAVRARFESTEEHEPTGFGGYLNIAVRAAHAAGEHIVRKLDRLEKVKVSEKQHNDFVTEVDQAAEQIIIETLHEFYPEHGFLGEESGVSGNDEGNSKFRWIIDPLDGTTNFIHGNPMFCVSIALEYKGEVVVGVVYDPNRNETFTALKGSGSQLNGHKIRVSPIRDLDRALIGTGIPFRKSAGQELDEQLDDYFVMLRKIILNTAGIRRPGAAALDLAWLAAGRIDGFWELGLKSWDIAAGALLVAEAGGMVSDLKGGQNFLESGDILAGSPRIHVGMEKLLLRP